MENKPMEIEWCKYTRKNNRLSGTFNNASEKIFVAIDVEIKKDLFFINKIIFYLKERGETISFDVTNKVFTDLKLITPQYILESSIKELKNLLKQYRKDIRTINFICKNFS